MQETAVILEPRMTKRGEDHGRADHSDRGGRSGYPGRRAHLAFRRGIPYHRSRKRHPGTGGVPPGGRSGDPGYYDAGYERPARLRGAAQALHSADPVPHGKITGVR